MKYLLVQTKTMLLFLQACCVPSMFGKSNVKMLGRRDFTPIYELATASNLNSDHVVATLSRPGK